MVQVILSIPWVSHTHLMPFVIIILFLIIYLFINITQTFLYLFPYSLNWLFTEHFTLDFIYENEYQHLWIVYNIIYIG